MQQLGRPGILAAVIAAACLMGPQAMAAQSTLEQRVVDRRLEHREATSAYTAAVDALRVRERAFNTALTDVQTARNGGDEDALAAARAAFMDHTGPLAEAQVRVQARADSLGVVRQALLDVLVLREAELLDMLDAATTAAARRDLNALLEDVNNQIDELEAEADSPATVMPAVGNVTFDPRDGPEQLENKATILEALAARVDTVILDLDERIAALEERERNQRRQLALLSDLGRFGDLAPPTGPPGADPTQQRGDSTAASGRAITTQDRIQLLRDERARLVDYRDQLLIRAEQFRQAIRRRS